LSNIIYARFYFIPFATVHAIEQPRRGVVFFDFQSEFLRPTAMVQSLKFIKRTCLSDEIAKNTASSPNIRTIPELSGKTGVYSLMQADGLVSLTWTILFFVNSGTIPELSGKTGVYSLMQADGFTRSDL